MFGLADLANDLKQKADMEKGLESGENKKPEKLDDEIVSRLKKATNLSEKEIAARHEEFNKMFPEKKGIVARPLDKLLYFKSFFSRYFSGTLLAY